MSVERGLRAAGFRSLVEANTEPGASYDGDDHEEGRLSAEDLANPDVAMMKASARGSQALPRVLPHQKGRARFQVHAHIRLYLRAPRRAGVAPALGAAVLQVGMKEVLFDAVAGRDISPSAWCRPRWERWTGSSSAWSASCSASDRSSSSSRPPRRSGPRPQAEEARVAQGFVHRRPGAEGWRDHRQRADGGEPPRCRCT